MGHDLRATSLADYNHSQDDSVTQMANTSQTVANTRCNTPYHHICSRDRLLYVNGQEAKPLVPLDDMIDPLLRDLEFTKYNKPLDLDAVRWIVINCDLVRQQTPSAMEKTTKRRKLTVTMSFIPIRTDKKEPIMAN